MQQCLGIFLLCLLKMTFLCLIISHQVKGPDWIMPSNRVAMRDKVLEMFNHAYTSYMDKAYPADELMPIACKGRVRGVTESRGDVDDALGNFSLTLVDTLDTLAVLGLFDEFEDAVKRVERDVKVNADLVVSVFETNIRVLGGLLGGHAAAIELQLSHNRMHWYNGSLLVIAKELGDRLLPAFNTTTGMPMSRVNLASGSIPFLHKKDTCTACAGTMVLEMAALTRFTGDPIYEQKARKAMDYLWSRRQRSSDLMGTVLNVHNGQWVRKESGIGAGIDSYYEYLLKAYILLGDEDYLERFNTHYQAIKQYCQQGPMMIDVHMHKPTVAARHFIDALGAFWPGLQVLKGDLSSAIETHELLYQVFLKHKFLPEAFTTTFDIYWGQYPLRPEFAESTYLLYKATGDPYYLDVGQTIVENLEKHARVKCGYAGIKDVRTFKHEDRMDSYFLAEMFKYLYLLFSEGDAELPGNKGIDMDKFVLTTEAHLMPLYLSNVKVNGSMYSEWHSTVNLQGNFDRSCPNSELVNAKNISPLTTIRNKVQNYFKGTDIPTACKRAPDASSTSILWSGKRSLTAEQYVQGNSVHSELLNKMGINIVAMPDGKVQLVLQPQTAATTIDAKEGELFLHEMIELSKRETMVPIESKVIMVQLLSRPYLGAILLQGSSAQFGPDVSNMKPLTGSLVLPDDMQACIPLTQPENVKGKIAVVRRGGCMFVEKVKHVENAGAIGVILLDNDDASSFEISRPFQMAGDGKTETNIPSIFLFSKESIALMQAVLEDTQLPASMLQVAITTNEIPLDEVVALYQVEDATESSSIYDSPEPFEQQQQHNINNNDGDKISKNETVKNLQNKAEMKRTKNPQKEEL